MAFTQDFIVDLDLLKVTLMEQGKMADMRIRSLDIFVEFLSVGLFSVNAFLPSTQFFIAQQWASDNYDRQAYSAHIPLSQALASGAQNSRLLVTYQSLLTQTLGYTRTLVEWFECPRWTEGGFAHQQSYLLQACINILSSEICPKLTGHMIKHNVLLLLPRLVRLRYPVSLRPRLVEATLSLLRVCVLTIALHASEYDKDTLTLFASQLCAVGENSMGSFRDHVLGMIYRSLCVPLLLVEFSTMEGVMLCLKLAKTSEGAVSSKIYALRLLRSLLPKFVLGMFS